MRCREVPCPQVTDVPAVMEATNAGVAEREKLAKQTSDKGSSKKLTDLIPGMGGQAASDASKWVLVVLVVVFMHTQCVQGFQYHAGCCMCLNTMCVLCDSYGCGELLCLSIQYLTRVAVCLRSRVSGSPLRPLPRR